MLDINYKCFDGRITKCDKIYIYIIYNMKFIIDIITSYK